MGQQHVITDQCYSLTSTLRGENTLIIHKTTPVVEQWIQNLFCMYRKKSVDASQPLKKLGKKGISPVIGKEGLIERSKCVE